MKKDLDSILEYLQDLATADLIDVHRDFCYSTNSFDTEIFENNEEFFETNFGDNVMSAVRAATYGDYRYTDEYVSFDGYGNLRTFDFLREEIDFNEIAKDILENPDNYYDIKFEENE